MTTKDEDCLLAIMKSGDITEGLSTAQILAKTIDFPDVCEGCSSGSHIIAAGNMMVDKGVLRKELAKGGYRWHLIE
ncbi:MAG: hypothetical protein ACTSYA_11435 [Candidatus Kariarchaeaceae archaeon]